MPTISATGGVTELLPFPEGFDPETGDPRDYTQTIYPEGGAHQMESPDLVGAHSPYPLLADRPDVLVFQTEPLETDVEVTGGIEVVLWVSSSAVDTDFTAKLLDVYPPSEDYPDGYHLNLADSIIRARYRNGFERAELMKPGEVYRVGIPLPPISNLFKAGHRIRLDIASSNFPKFDVNPNTGEPMGRHTRTVRGPEQRVRGQRPPLPRRPVDHTYGVVVAGENSLRLEVDVLAMVAMTSSRVVMPLMKVRYDGAS